jgi:hypothetical protein
MAASVSKVEALLQLLFHEDVPLVVEKLAAPVSGNTFPEGVVTLFHRSDRHEQEVPEEIEVVEQA